MCGDQKTTQESVPAFYRQSHLLSPLFIFCDRVRVLNQGLETQCGQ